VPRGLRERRGAGRRGRDVDANLRFLRRMTIDCATLSLTRTLNDKTNSTSNSFA
jgi:hypothetical protein